MQIKTTVSYHLALIRKTIIKKTRNNAYEFPSAHIFISCVSELVQTQWRTAQKFPKNMENRPPMWSSYPTSKHIIHKNDTHISKTTVYTYVSVSVYVRARCLGGLELRNASEITPCNRSHTRNLLVGRP